MKPAPSSRSEKLKVSELEDKYLRANADFDNMKRRLEKRKNASYFLCT